ncbi:AraC family transcriptional regulator [Burkholderia singularis]|uniref:Transcriptional regulator, AraC family n=2 Tax=Burkholderia singularis TaxID=1503053 RepID=A0A238H0P6_9BURK|nr:Transcriptional regulator, AraC family [Burkholderia singularis]
MTMNSRLDTVEAPSRIASGVPHGASALAQSSALHDARRELAARVARFAPVDGAHQTAISALSFHRFSSPVDLGCSVPRASFVFAAQGAKRVTVAGHVYEYDPQHCLVTSVDLPMLSQVTRASVDAPYLCVSVALDLQRIAELAAEMQMPAPDALPAGEGIVVGALSEPLFDAALRLVRLLDTPGDIPILAPLIEKELLYRLLTSELGARLRHIAIAGSQTYRIARAIEWIRTHYAQPLRIETLAQQVNMSVSSLHHHFKHVTTLSPLQYQKQLRLHEARRLLLAQGGDVGSIALRVGYESPSQFSREYSRLFGAPPLRDVGQLRRRNGGGTTG